LAHWNATPDHTPDPIFAPTFFEALSLVEAAGFAARSSGGDNRPFLLRFQFFGHTNPALVGQPVNPRSTRRRTSQALPTRFQLLFDAASGIDEVVAAGIMHGYVAIEGLR
jgi:hypothetical protein